MIRSALIALLVLSAAWFAWRGPARALAGSADFLLFHSAARAWLSGSNPYNADDVSRAWAASGGDPAGDPKITRPVSSLIYAPPMFVVLAPLAALPQAAANDLWAILNVGFLCFSLWALARIAGLEGSGRLAFWSAGFILAPASTGVFVGQLSLLILALLCGGHLLRIRGAARRAPSTDAAGPAGGGPDHRGTIWAGVLIGLAAIIKPQMGLLFLVYEAGRLRHRSVLGGLIAIVALTILGVARLELAGIEWFATWREHLHLFATIGDGDPSHANHMRYHLIHLAYPLHSMLESRDLIRVLVVGFLGSVSLAYFVVDLRRGRQSGEGYNELLSLSMTATVTLLVAYHRTYDAVLLAFPLAMAVRGVLQGAHGTGPGQWPPRWNYGVILLLLSPFAIPGSIILHKAAAEWELVPKGVAASLAWDAIVVPHATWAMVLLSLWLVYLRGKMRPAEIRASYLR